MYAYLSVGLFVHVRLSVCRRHVGACMRMRVYICVCVCMYVCVCSQPVLVLAQAVPLGHLPARVAADLMPVGSAGRQGAPRPQDQAAHHLVLSGAVEVHDQELHGDVGQQLGRHVVDEGLVEDGVQRALLHVGLFLGDAPATVIHVHFHVRV